MLGEMSKRVGDAWKVITRDGEIRSLVGRDWASFLEFLQGLMEILLPLLTMCPADPAEVKSRATRWVAAIRGGVAARRHLGLIERLQLAMWQRQINRKLGPEVSDEIDNTELQQAVLTVISQATPDEVSALRAEADRAKEAAA